MNALKTLGVQEPAEHKECGINMNNNPTWQPMTDEDWEWVNYGRLPQK